MEDMVRVKDMKEDLNCCLFAVSKMCRPETIAVNIFSQRIFFLFRKLFGLKVLLFNATEK